MVPYVTHNEGRVVAFMDIGTNSIRLLVVRINKNHSYTILTQQKEAVRLGEGEFYDRRLHPSAMQRAVLVAREFAGMAHSYGATEILPVATSATREASNRTTFLRKFRNETQLNLRVISGKEEARLIYLGVASGIQLNRNPTLFIDIGGGSTEVIVGNQRQHDLLETLKLGAIRLTTLFFSPDYQKSVSSKKYAKIQDYVRNAAVHTIQRAKDFNVKKAIGSSGTIMNLGDIHAHLFNNRKLKRHDVLTYDQLKNISRHLCSLSLDERRKVPGINPERADIIIAGAAIIETLMEEIGIERLTISDRSLRDGLLIDYLSRTEQAYLLEEMSVRQRSVMQLGKSCGFAETHAKTVARLALQLFDQTKSQDMHNMGQWERELLEYAALLHDVGAFLSYENHHAHTYYLIRNADLLGFDQTELELIAATARFHRKGFPKKKRPELANLDKKSRKTVKRLAVIIRLAESLDRSHNNLVKSAEIVKTGKKTTDLKIISDNDCKLEIWGAQKHIKTFKKAFKTKLTAKTTPQIKTLTSVKDVS